jgi:16S rRNA (cytosine1402-N4)-methyltransferase
MYHVPVLSDACIDGLNIRPDGTYVDVTFGSGGHSRKILEKLSTGRLFAFDRDKDAERNTIDDGRFLLINQNYRYIKNFLRFQGIHKIDGILADLGISSWQIDQPERGFSIRYDGKLDMRMDQEQAVTGAEVLNSYPVSQLEQLFWRFGDISNARSLVREIVSARELKPIETTEELRSIAIRVAPRGKENQYLAKVFQAIRIEVNEEIESLKEMLQHASDLLNPGGRLVVIAYHSLEDRLVKNFIKTGNFEGVLVKDFFGRQISPLNPVSRKAITPTEAEQMANPRSRSAKLRIAEKNP